MAGGDRKLVSTQALKAATRKFFNLHWSEKLSEDEAPRWVRLEPENMAESVHQGGCYAILDGAGNVSYVGLGIARSRKKGAPGGVLRRLYRHVIFRGALSKGELKPKPKREKPGLSGILYVPFPNETEDLAAALEIYLIDRFGPRLTNKSRVRRELAEAVES